MILGEHAVLNNYLSLVAAISSRIYLDSSFRSDKKIRIFSDDKFLETDSDHLPGLWKSPESREFNYILNTIETCQSLYSEPKGMDLRFRSEIPTSIGLGSSAAVVAVTCAAILSRFTKVEEIHSLGLKIIKRIQGAGSGADLAASIYGGLIQYRQPKDKSEAEIKQLKNLPSIVLFYSGSNKPTGEVIKIVDKWRQDHPELATKIFQSMNKSIVESVEAINKQQWSRLGELIDTNYSFQKTMQLTNPEIENLVKIVKQDPKIIGVKIAGSGLGDCILGLTKPRIDWSSFNAQLKVQPIVISKRGIEIQK